MPTKISSREVLAYLNDLGYSNVNAQQLKEFIRDLKKLIKFEERRKSEGEIGENTEASISTEPNSSRRDNETRYSDIFSTLYEQGTVASMAKAVRKKESVVSIQIKKSKPRMRCSEHNDNLIVEEAGRSNISNTFGAGEAKSLDNKNSREVQKEAGKQSSVTECGDSRKVGAKKGESESLKPKASFIRPVIPMKHKSDPVALYHQYQAHWKRQKMPGEDSRTELRWAIREKMSRGPR